MDLPLELNGEGAYCHKTSGEISAIRSRDMKRVEINGVDYTNTYSTRMPARFNGYYYIGCVGDAPSSHMEVFGSGPAGVNVPVTGIKVDQAALSIDIDGSAALNASVLPENATDRSVHWQSDEPGIVSVDPNGRVTGLSVGVTAITASTTDGGFEASSHVTVEPSTPSQTRYTLTIAITGDGSTEPPPGSYTYTAGASVSVAATANNGAVFTGWGGAVVRIDNPVTLEVFNGSHCLWSRVLVRNGRTAVRAMEWKSSDGSKSGVFPYAQDPENTFAVPVDEVLQSDASSSFLITVHYIDGAAATVTLSSFELATPGAYPLD